MNRSQRVKQLKDFLDGEEKLQKPDFSHTSFIQFKLNGVRAGILVVGVDPVAEAYNKMQSDLIAAGILNNLANPPAVVSICNCGDPMFLPHRSTCPVVCRT